MKNQCENTILRNKNRKIVNLFKYLVLIFAFLLVGVVGEQEGVRAVYSAWAKGSSAYTESYKFTTDSTGLIISFDPTSSDLKNIKSIGLYVRSTWQNNTGTELGYATYLEKDLTYDSFYLKITKKTGACVYGETSSSATNSCNSTGFLEWTNEKGWATNELEFFFAFKARQNMFSTTYSKNIGSLKTERFVRPSITGSSWDGRTYMDAGREQYWSDGSVSFNIKTVGADEVTLSVRDNRKTITQDPRGDIVYEKTYSKSSSFATCSTIGTTKAIQCVFKFIYYFEDDSYTGDYYAFSYKATNKTSLNSVTLADENYVWMDTKKPEVSSTIQASNPTNPEKTSTGTPIYNSLTMRFSATDGGSGVKRVCYQLWPAQGGEAEPELYGCSKDGVDSLSKQFKELEGIYYIVYYAEDFMGNISEELVTDWCKFDYKAPGISYNPLVNKNQKYLYVTIEDDYAGVHKSKTSFYLDKTDADGVVVSQGSGMPICSTTVTESCYTITKEDYLSIKYRITLPTLIYEGIRLRISAFDLAHNLNNAYNTEGIYFDIDNVAPEVDLLSVPSVGDYAKSHWFEIQVREENLSYLGYYLKDSEDKTVLTEEITKKSFVQINRYDSKYTSSFTFEIVTDLTGEYNLCVTAKDETLSGQNNNYTITKCSDNPLYFDNTGWTLRESAGGALVDGVSNPTAFGPNQTLTIDVYMTEREKVDTNSSKYLFYADQLKNSIKITGISNLSCDVDWDLDSTWFNNYKIVMWTITLSECKGPATESSNFNVVINTDVFSDYPTKFLDYAGNGYVGEEDFVIVEDLLWDSVSNSAESLCEGNVCAEDDYDIYSMPKIFDAEDEIYLHLNFDVVVRFAGTDKVTVSLKTEQGETLSVILDDISTDGKSVNGSDEISDSLTGRFTVESIDIGSLVDTAGNSVTIPSDFITDTQLYANIDGPEITSAKMETYLKDTETKFGEFTLDGENRVLLSNNLYAKIILSVNFFVPHGTSEDGAGSYFDVVEDQIYFGNENGSITDDYSVTCEETSIVSVDGWLATAEIVLSIEYEADLTFDEIVLNTGLVLEDTNGDYDLSTWRNESNLGTATMEIEVSLDSDSPGSIFTSNSFDGVKEDKVALLTYHNPSNGFYIAGDSGFYNTEEYCDLIDLSGISSCETKEKGIVIHLSSEVYEKEINIVEVYNEYGIRYTDEQSELTVNFYNPQIDVEVTNSAANVYLEKVNTSKWNLFVEESYISSENIELKVSLSQNESSGGSIGCILEGINLSSTSCDLSGSVTEYSSALTYDQLSGDSININYVIGLNDRLTTKNITITLYRYDTDEITYDLESIFVTENSRKSEVIDFSNGISLNGLYGDTIEMIYSIVDGNTFKPTYSFKNSVEDYAISLISSANSDKFTNKPNIDVTVVVDADNNIKLTFTLNDKLFGLVYMDTIDIYNVDDSFVSPTGIDVRQLEDELVIVNDSSVYIPCMDSSCDTYAVITDSTDAFEYDVTVTQPDNKVYFERYDNGQFVDVTSIDSPSFVENKETNVTLQKSLGLSDTTVYSFVAEEDLFAPVITEIVSCDEIDDQLIVTKGNGFCFKVTIKDNWQYGLKIDSAVYVDEANNLKITFDGVNVTMNENSDDTYKYINTFDFIFTYKLNNESLKGNIVTKNSVDILGYILGYNDGIIHDVSDNSADFEGEYPNFDIMFVPEGLEIVNVSVSDSKQYHNSDISVTLEFNREIMGPETISANIGYGNESGICLLQADKKTFVCTLNNEEEFSSLTFRADSLIDANGLEYGVTKSWSASELFGYDFVVIDKSKPDINFVGDTSDKYFNSNSEITLRFKVVDSYLDSSVNAYPTVKVGATSCSEVSKNILDGVVTVVVKCDSTGNVSYSFEAGSFKDLAGNESDSVAAELSNYKVSIEEFEHVQEEYALEAIAANTTKSSVVRYVEFNEDISSFKAKDIQILGGIGAKLSVEKYSSRVLKLTIEAKNILNSLNGMVEVNFGEGSVTNIYGNGVAEFVLDTSVNVVNGEFNMTDLVVDNDGCEEVNGYYYCNVGDKLKFVAKSDRPIKGENTLTLKVNGETIVLNNSATANYVSELRYEYSISNLYSNEVLVEFVSLDISDMTDEFGNVGISISELDLTKYVIDTLSPEFNSNSAKKVVNLGHPHNESNICKEYYDSADVYSCGVSVKNGTIDNYLDDSNTYYAKASEGITLVLTIVDKAGNSSSKEIILVIDNSEVLSVVFKDKVITYGDTYSYDSSNDATVIVPASFANIGVTEANVLALLNPVLQGVEKANYGSLDAGEYVITSDGSNEITVNGVKFSFTVVNGTLTVEPKKVNLSDYNFTISKVYDGKIGIARENVVIRASDGTVVANDFTWDDKDAYFVSSEAGTQNYTIMYIKHSSSNYVIDGNNTKTGTGTITAKNINVSDITNISKYVDGTTSVEQSSFVYVDSDINNKEVLISWTSANYESAYCSFGDNDSCDVKVSLSGLKTNNANYTIDNSGKTTGELKLNNDDYTVTLKDERENKITGAVYTNKNTYTLSVASINYGSTLGNLSTHTYKWCASSSELTEDICATSTASDTSYGVSLDEGKNYVYLVVTNASGKETVASAIIYKNTKFGATTVSLNTNSKPVAVTYYIRNTIEVILALNSKLKDETNLSNLILSFVSYNGVSYVFNYSKRTDTYDSLGMPITNLHFTYTVVRNVGSQIETDLEYDSMSGFSGLVDVYGNAFDTKSNVTQEGPIINIDTSPGTISEIHFEVNKDYDYIKVNEEVELDVYLMFTGVIKKALNMSPVAKVIINGQVSDQCSVIADEYGNETIIQCSYASFSTNKVGNIVIESFDDAKVRFDLADDLVLDSTYVSKMNKENKVFDNSIYVDGEELELTFSPSSQTVSESAEVYVAFNKDTLDKTFVSISDYKALFGIIDDNLDISYSCDKKNQNCKFVVTYSGTDAKTFTFNLLEENAITDYVGNIATGNEFTITFDNNELSIDSNDIEFNESGNCISETCGNNSEIEVVIPFSRNVEEVMSATIYYTFGSVSGSVGYSSIVNGSIVFIVPISSQNGEFALTNISYSVKDDLGRTKEVSNASLSKPSGIIADTLGPSVPSASVESICENTVCKNGDKIKFTLVFDEMVKKYSLEVVTNFGSVRLTNEIPVSLRNSLMVEMTISGSGDSSLVVNSIVGTFVDIFDNESSYDEEIIIDSYSVDIDNTAPVVGSVNLTGTAYNQQSEAEIITVTKGQNEMFDASKVCLKNVDTGSVVCAKGNENPIEFNAENGQITIKFATLSGSYQIVLLEGFIYDLANNMSAYNDESRSFAVSSNRDNIIVSDIVISGGNSQVTADNGTYYYIDNSSILTFNIYAKSTSGSTQFSLNSNACENIKFYKVNTDFEEVTGLFDCAKTASKNVKISIKSGVNLEEYVDNMYFFVIEGTIMTNVFNNPSNSFVGEGVISLVVTPALEEKTEERVFSTNNVVGLFDEGENTFIYYIKNISSLDITFKFNNPIKKYELNNSSYNVDGKYDVKIRGFKEGTSYDVVFYDYRDHEVEFKVIVYKDNSAPSINVSHNHVGNYIANNELNLSFTCVDSVDNYNVSGSGVDCLARTFKVYRNDELLDVSSYVIESNGENTKITLVGDSENGDVIKVEYAIQDSLKNVRTETVSFTVDREVPQVSVSINKSPVKSDELVATVTVVASDSGLKNKVINYKWVNGEIEVVGTANIVNGKATVYGKDITLDGEYTLVILPISNNVNGESVEYSHSSKVIVDNTAASINGEVVTSVNEFSESSCKVVNDIKYCKGESNFVATVTLDENVSEVIASAEGFTTQVVINGNVATITMYANANASNRIGVELSVVTTDIAGNVNSNALVVTLSDVVVDTTNDFSGVTVSVDNEVKNNPTKITDIVVSHNDTYAGISSVKYEVVGDGIYASLDDVKSIKFDKTTDIIVIVEDFAGNIGRKTYTVQIDNVAPRFDVVLKDGSYSLKTYTYAETIDVVITSSDSDIVAYCVSLSECSPTNEWANSEPKVTLQPGNNNVYIYVKDASNNVSVITKSITFMDISVTNNNGDVSYSNGYNITISGVDTGYNVKVGYGILLETDTIFDSIYTKKIVTLNETSVTLNETLTGVNGVYKVAMKVYVDDKSGYSKILLINNLHIDTKLDFDGDPIYNNDWTNSSIPVQLYVTEDEISELMAELWKSNSNNKFVKVNDCTIDDDKLVTCYASENGTYKIKVKDAAGNMKETERGLINITGIDKVGQTGNIEVIGDGTVYNTYHDVVVKYDGSGAPISKVMYLLFDKVVTLDTFETLYNENAATAVHGTLKIKASYDEVKISNVTGQFKLYVYVVDEAGNKVLTSEDLYLDNTAPVISFKEFNAGYTQVRNVQDLVSVTDSHVGMGSKSSVEYLYVQYDESDNEIVYYDLNELEGSYFVRVTAKDDLGNRCTVESEMIVRIDNIAPRIEKMNTAADAEPEYKVTDLGSRIASIKYCYGLAVEGCSYTIVNDVHGNDISSFIIDMPDTSASFALRIVAMDIAGNEYVYDGNIVYDTKAPTINYTLYNGLNNEFDSSDYIEENGRVTFSKYTNKDILISLNIEDEISTSENICSYVVYASDSIVGKNGSYNCDQTGIEYEGIALYNVSMSEGKYEVSANNVGAYGGVIYVTVFAMDEAGNSEFKVFVVDNVSNKKITYQLTNEMKDPTAQTSIKVHDFSVLMSEIVSVKYKKVTNVEDIPVEELYTGIAGEGTVVNIDTEDNEYRLNVVENGLYVFEVVDKWGNSTYSKITITNIDGDAPELVDVTLKVENGELFENNNGYINENKEANITVGSNMSFIYNGKLSIELDALADAGVASVYLKLCYAGECRLIELSRETYNIISIDPEYTGTITYSVEDAAGNNSGQTTSFDVKYYGANSLVEKEHSFEVGINTALIDVNKKYNNLNIDYSILDNTNRYKAIEFYLLSSGNEDTIENRVCDSGWLDNDTGTYTLTCSGKEFDGYYMLKYKVKDILGNENDSKEVIQVYLDNVKPSNTASDMSFKLVAEKVDSETYYKLRYLINREHLLDVSQIKILHDNEDVYCTINNFAIKGDDCGILDDSRFDENNELKFKTVFIDTAGNESEYANYSIKYDNSRKMSATLDYDSITKTMKITVLVDNAYGNVTKVLVSFVNSENKTLLNEYNLLNDVTNVDVTNKMYHLYVSEHSHASLFVNHVIDGTFTIKVHDSYDVVVDSTEIGRESLKVQYDVTDISVVHKSTTNTVITTLDKSTRIYVISNKELIEAKYILRKVSDENIGDITVSTFENVYNNCWKDQYCVNGELVRNEESLEYSYVILSNKKSGKDLVSAEYELIIYAMDEYEHKIVDSGKSIYIDNTKPIIKETDENGTILRPAFKETIIENEETVSVKVYDKVITLNISDNSALYNSGIKSIELFKDGSTKSIYNFDTDDIGKLEMDDIRLGIGSYEEGYYKIVVTDLVGNQTVEYILVDVNNDGIAMFLNGSLTNKTTFNLSALQATRFALNEDMRMIKLEMFASTTIMISVQINSDGTGRVCYRNGTSYPCSNITAHGFTMEMNSQLTISQLLNLAGATMNGLSKDINKMVITVHNRSVKEVKYEYILDFVKPIITVNSGISYEGKKITVYKGDDCTGACYGLKTVVMTSQGADEVAKALQDIITKYFIAKVDGNSYNSSIAEKLEISINGKTSAGMLFETSFNASLIDWSDYNILHETGTYLVSVVYTETSQNKSEPVALRIEVEDNEAPTITLNESSTGVDRYIESDEGITYTDLGAVGKDNYGFDKEGKVRITDVYSLTINGVIVSLTEDYEVLPGVFKVGNVYKFTCGGAYEFIYTVIDSANYVASSKIKVQVFDHKAPNMVDPNKHEINSLNGNRYFTIEGLKYVINEYQGVIYDVGGIEVIDSVFELNGKEYTIYDDYVILSGININSSMICFEDVNDCENRLQAITARDEQDKEDKEVSILEILYSPDGVISYGTASYSIDPKYDSMFRINSITFDKIGYYKVVFKAEDSAKNRSRVEYIIRVFDIDKPLFKIDDNNYSDGATHTMTEQLGDIFEKVSNLSGVTLRDKISSWVTNWMLNADNVKYQDNYMIDKASFSVSEVRLLDRVFENKEFARYEVTLTVSDTSGNASSVIVTVIVKDSENPINGEIVFSYSSNMDPTFELNDGEICVNEKELHFTLSNGSDKSNEFHYEYIVEINGELQNNGEWQKYEGNHEMAYIGANTTDRVRVLYKVVDALENESEVYSSGTIMFDNSKPNIVISAIGVAGGQEVVLENLQNGVVYDGEASFIRVSITEDQNDISIKKYHNNSLIVDTNMTIPSYSEYNDGIFKFGHYKYIITDRAGNESSVEFIKMPQSNDYIVMDRNSISSPDNALTEQVRYDKVVLQKLYTYDENIFYFEDMSIVNNNDAVYFLGVVKNAVNEKAGALFSIYANPVKGELFKEHIDYFPLNTISNINGLFPQGILVNPYDYLINMNGEKYILVGIVADGYVEEDIPDEPEQEATEGGSTSSANMSWVLYVLGGIGVIGGGFLIMRLKRRIRAA